MTPMCCRYYFSDTPGDERVNKIIAMMERDYAGQYKTGEIFPGDSAAAVIGEKGKLRHVPAVFGFQGAQKGRLIINARSETAAEKPMFAAALRERRAILPADGFYEWARDENRTKYLFTLEGGRTLYLCGLYSLVEGKYRFVILTRPANDSMKDVHDRMPVTVSADQVRAYLTDYETAREMIAAPAPWLFRAPAQ
ncbi:MAG: SOS response-associated peptidase [Clostridia bacterium]|nr:SOS response-associated peptidase [Clostridia bacterium]